MARQIPSSLLIARQMLAPDPAADGPAAWLWFMEIARAAAGGGGYYRLVENPRAVRANSGLVWLPCAFAADIPEENVEGAIADMTVTLPNVGRLTLAELEARNIQGQLLTVWAQKQGDWDPFTDSLRWRFRVLKATATEKAVQLTAGHPANLVRLPQDVFDGSVAPAFNVTAGGAV